MPVHLGLQHGELVKLPGMDLLQDQCSLPSRQTTYFIQYFELYALDCSHRYVKEISAPGCRIKKRQAAHPFMEIAKLIEGTDFISRTAALLELKHSGLNRSPSLPNGSTTVGSTR